MKVKRVAAMVLACTMLVGQVAYADEYVGNDVYGGSVEEENQQEIKTAEYENYADDTEHEAYADVYSGDVYETSLSYTSLENLTALYTNYPRVDGVQIVNAGGCSDFRIESEDESVVEVQLLEETDAGIIYYAFCGKAEGETDVFLTYAVSGGETRRQEKLNTITVTTLPDDAVPMDDAVLISDLVKHKSAYDGNHDGYISYNEMKYDVRWIEGSPYPDLSIRNLNGVEYTEYLWTVDLSNHTELGDITPLKSCTQLEKVDLSGTGVADITALENHNRLYELDLSGTNVTDIAALENCSKLRTLYLSKTKVTDFSSLKNCQYLDLSEMQLTDISTLSECKKLENIVLRNNETLKNIETLFGMTSLVNAYLDGTAVSAEDRLRLAGISDGRTEMYKGHKQRLLKVGGVFGDDFYVEKGNGAEKVILDEQSWLSNYCALPLEEGQVQITLYYESKSVPFEITILGKPFEQETGEKYEYEVNIIGEGEDAQENTILTDEGELWKIGSSVKKIAGNVKAYEGGWVGYNVEIISGEICVLHMYSEWAEYWLDNNDVLWNETGKVAENIAEFDAHYALDKNGILIDLFRDGEESITNVKEWWDTYEGEDNYANTYVLKEDGTLWKREEVAKDQPAEVFVKVADNVRERKKEGSYITNDNVYTGYFSQLEGITSYAWTPDRLEHSYNDYIYDTEGNLIVYTSQSVIYNVGNIGKIIQLVEVEESSGYGGGTTTKKVFIQNEQKQVYLIDLSNEGKTELIAENVEEINDEPKAETWLARLQDGTYCGMDGNTVYTEGESELKLKDITIDYVLSTVVISERQEYDLILCASGSKIVRKNDVNLLDNIETIWNRDGDNVYALRTDGTIWDITTIPTKIIDLAADDFQKGDVNEDDSVDIQDLRTILRYVCGKTTLDERQLKIADVYGDGVVDIQDLRKVLRFVCGKIESLE